MLLNKMLFLFEADADSIKKGTQEGKKGADDLTSAMKKADEQSKKTSNNFAKFAKGALGWVAAAAAASKSMSMAVARAGEIEALDTLSLKMGASITQTDALARSIVGLGGSTDQAQADLNSLADGMRERNMKPMEGMLDLADQLAGMNYEQATKTLKNYGITERSTIELLRKGSGEVRRMMLAQEKNGAITQEAAEKAKAFNQSLNNLKQVSSDAANSFAQFLMPTLTKVIDFLAKAGKWAVENKTFVIAFFAGVAAIVTGLYLPAMLSAAAATIAATWPLIAMLAAAVAVGAIFALIYDDIMHFIDGNDSLIGQIINDFPIVGEIIDAVIGGIKIAFEVAGAAADALWNGFKVMASGIVGVFEWLWGAIKAYIGFITAGVGKVADVVGSVGKWLGGKLGIATEEKVTREVEDVYTGGDGSVSPSSRMSGVDFVDDGASRSGGDTVYNNDNSRTTNEVINSTESAKQYTAQAQQQPANAMTSSAINNQRTNNIESNLTIGQVTVETQATDASGVSAGLSDSLSAELEKMQANNATPITR